MLSYGESVWMRRSTWQSGAQRKWWMGTCHRRCSRRGQAPLSSVESACMSLSTSFICVTVLVYLLHMCIVFVTLSHVCRIRISESEVIARTGAADRGRQLSHPRQGSVLGRAPLDVPRSKGVCGNGPAPKNPRSPMVMLVWCGVWVWCGVVCGVVWCVGVVCSNQMKRDVGSRENDTIVK